ncbi:MAG TPA: hypothetical protein VK627_00960 [Edaphobacter sp.]|nr:hypothetical protein [Edaphobacter sp.]
MADAVEGDTSGRDDGAGATVAGRAMALKSEENFMSAPCLPLRERETRCPSPMMGAFDETDCPLALLPSSMTNTFMVSLKDLMFSNNRR